MTRHNPVPMDTAAEIRELDAEGLGRNSIAQHTGINASTVRNILAGTAVQFNDKLTTRQIDRYLMSMCRGG